MDEPVYKDGAAFREELIARGLTPDAFTEADIKPYIDQVTQGLAQFDHSGVAAAIAGLTEPATTDDPVALIVETRVHPNLPFVVAQMHEMCNLRIQLFHSPENEAYIKGHPKLRALIARGDLVLTRLASAAMSAQLYNALFTSPSFWDLCIGRGKILVFQTDSVLCPGSDYDLGDFLDFDYIGSAWARLDPHNFRKGGNGGLSLRDWGRQMECLRRFPPSGWRGGEDFYFALVMDILGHRVASFEEAAKFSTEYFLIERSFGIHKPSMSRWATMLRILRYCPEAWRLVPRIYRWRLRLMRLRRN